MNERQDLPPARRVKRFRELAFACTLIFCAFIAVAFIVRLIKDLPYQRALKLLDEGRYQECYQSLERIWVQGEIDVFPLMDAMVAFKEYNAGNVKEARRRLVQWSNGRRMQQARYLPAKYEEKILDLQARVNNEYDQIVAEEEKERARKQELERERYQQEKADAREKLKDQWPYIGMPETYISLTRLGEYARFSEFDQSGKHYRYYYFTDAKGKVTASVNCSNNVVIYVVDWINNRRRNRNNTWKSLAVKRSSSSETDPYNAKDYMNEEDFYDDHYDDFFDYYQAEEYWRDHQ